MFQLGFIIFLAIVSTGIYAALNFRDKNKSLIILFFSIYSISFYLLDYMLRFIPSNYIEIPPPRSIFISLFGIVLLPLLSTYIQKNLKLEIQNTNILGSNTLFKTKIHMIILCLVFFLINSTSWFAVQFEVSRNFRDMFQLEIPISFNFYLLVSFIVHCIAPVIMLVAVILELDIVSKHFTTNIFLSFKKKKFSCEIPINKILHHGCVILSLSMLLLFLFRISNVIWNLKFEYNKLLGVLFLSSRPYFNHENIFLYSLLFTFILLILIIVFNFRLTPNKQKKKASKSILNVIGTLTIFLASLLHYTSKWFNEYFANQSLDSIIFHLSVPLEGTDSKIIATFIQNCLASSVFISIFGFIILNLLSKESYAIEFNGKSTVTGVIRNRKAFVYSVNILPIVIFLFSANAAIERIDGYRLIKEMNTDSKFIEQNYVDPRNVNIDFPDEKRNLIHIYLESMESTYKSKEIGGLWSVNLIPELTQLAQENIYFSNTNNVGGGTLPIGAGFTMGALFESSSGLPFKLPASIDGNAMNIYEEFFPGVQSLGDILKNEGYTQEVIFGSDASFGGRLNYYTQHGNFISKDLFTASQEGIIQEGYRVWWGFEDEYLYEYARKELAKLSREDKPFNLTILTVDTHSPGGYRCRLCGNEHGNQYENVISCASRQVKDFIDWLKRQRFYENTSVVVTGDHLSMDSFVPAHSNKENRTIYNTFINSSVNTDNFLNRQFTTMDLFPTILASMGINIAGDRLALGTNLFSSTQTYAEEYGATSLKDEINKKSLFYNSFLN